MTMTRDEAIAALGGVEKAREVLRRKHDDAKWDTDYGKSGRAIVALALASLADDPADALREQLAAVTKENAQWEAKWAATVDDLSRACSRAQANEEKAAKNYELAQVWLRATHEARAQLATATATDAAVRVATEAWDLANDAVLHFGHGNMGLSTANEIVRRLHALLQRTRTLAAAKQPKPAVAPVPMPMALPARMIEEVGRMFEYCPCCSNSLDTGWECNDGGCGRDWMPLVKAVTASQPPQPAPAAAPQWFVRDETTKQMVAVPKDESPRSGIDGGKSGMKPSKEPTP